jgi:tetratricopeptide (TPR) repeat protein
LLDDTFRDALPVVFDFLGVPDGANPPPAQMSPEARQRILLGVIRHLVEARAGEGPGVVLVEDLHWLDPSSEVFLENLIEALPGSRTLVVVNFRPEYRASWTKRSYYQQLPLLPLDGRAIAELAVDLLGGDPSLDGLDELLAERTGGNPFFIEEVVQGLIESGALDGDRGAYRLTRSLDELTIPATVHALLAARIDRLPEREKTVLQSAAVIGREFTEPVLEAVTQLGDGELRASLAALRDAEMVFEKTLYPEAEYAFKHALTEEVAYGALLTERRARLHARVAEALEQLYPERLDELAALLASHWEQAGDSTNAGRWNARAAAWAGTHHPVDALRHWRRVRELFAEAQPSDEVAGLRFAACLWILQLGWRFGLEEREIEEVFKEARELAGDDKSSQALAFLAHGIAVGMTGDIGRAGELVVASERLAEEAGNRAVAACSGAAFWLYLEGRIPEAIAETERVMPNFDEDPVIGREVLGFSPYLWSVMWLGCTLLPEAGRIAEARRMHERVLALSREHDDFEVLGWAETNYTTLADACGDGSDGLEHVRRGVDTAERLGAPFSRLAAYQQMAGLHGVREEWEECEGWATRALQLIESTRTGVPYRGYVLGLLAKAVLARGDVARAAELAEQAVDETVRIGTRGFEARTRLVLGQVRDAQQKENEARREKRAALVLARECGTPIVEGRAHEALGELAEALAIYRKHGATGHERRVLGMLEQVPAQPG